jgi:hypothetical protein
MFRLSAAILLSVLDLLGEAKELLKIGFFQSSITRPQLGLLWHWRALLRRSQQREAAPLPVSYFSVPFVDQPR